jgi:hypothetical protein
MLLELMKLVKTYDCLDHVKSQVTAEVYTGECFGSEAIANHPDIFLNIANHLQNKKLFLEALQHVVGQTLAHNQDFGSLDQDVREVANKSVNDLELRVQTTCNSLYNLRTTAAFSDLVACSILQRYLLTQLATKRVASAEMFATFQFINKLVSGVELLEATGLAQLVDGAATISYGTATAINFLEEQDDHSDRQPSLDGLYNVQDLGLTPERIKTTLKSLVIRAQREIQPLMGVGDHCGYFTSIDLKDIYPWEKIVKQSLKVEE